MALDKFLRFLEHEKRYSRHTLKAYNSDLVQFQEFLQKAFEFSDFEAADHFQIRSWIVDLMSTGTSERSVNRKITSLNTFYKFLLREGLLKQNPMLKIQGPKVAKRLPSFVDKSKMDMLFDQLEFEDDFKGRRDKLILALFYQTGMRLSELSGLKVKDFDQANSMLKVLGKRNKERMIPVLAEIASQLSSHLNELQSAEGFIFVDENGKQLNQKYIYRMVRAKLGAVTSSEKRSPHILRHSFATHMLENGADINAIKELLGHASLAATQVYTHNTIEKLKSVHKQAHPKS